MGDMLMQQAAPPYHTIIPVTISGTTSTVTTTNAFEYVIDGRPYTHIAATNLATPTLDYGTGVAFLPIVANQGTIYAIGFNAAGTIKATQGSIGTLDAAGVFTTVPDLPSVPADFAPWNLLIVKGGATLVGTWTFGTDDNASVTGMTYDFNDIFSMPSRPITT